jgi:hypothetical protein
MEGAMHDFPSFLAGLAGLAALALALLARDWRVGIRERMWRREAHPLREWWLRHRH